MIAVQFSTRSQGVLKITILFVFMQNMCLDIVAFSRAAEKFLSPPLSVCIRALPSFSSAGHVTGGAVTARFIFSTAQVSSLSCLNCCSNRKPQVMQNFSLLSTHGLFPTWNTKGTQLKINGTRFFNFARLQFW